MLEVCSTTLPQKVLPKIFSDPRYAAYLQGRRDTYSARAEIAYQELQKIPNITVVKPSGAFYLTVVFNNGVLNATQTLPVANAAAQTLVEEKIKTLTESQLDKRFAYYLMASKGLCVVPLSGFNTDLYGFRMTLLEENPETFATILRIVTEAIAAYTSK
jgi:aspartate/methionine/tyrosine aminotransferase